MRQTKGGDRTWETRQVTKEGRESAQEQSAGKEGQDGVSRQREGEGERGEDPSQETGRAAEERGGPDSARSAVVVVSASHLPRGEERTRGEVGRAQRDVSIEL